MQVQMAEKLTVTLMDDSSESVAEFLSLSIAHTWLPIWTNQNQNLHRQSPYEGHFVNYRPTWSKIGKLRSSL